MAALAWRLARRLGSRFRAWTWALGYGIPPGVALLVNKKPAVKVGLLRLIQRSALLPFAHVDEVPGDRRRCSHCR